MPKLTDQPSLPSGAVNADIIHVVRSATSYQATVAQLLNKASVVTSSTAAPVVAPEKIGAIHIDTAEPAIYYGKGVSNTGDFVKVGSGGDSAANSMQITQSAHGFSVGETVYFDDATDTYRKGTAGDDVLGIVSAVSDANNFTVTQSGFVSGLSGLAAGEHYYVSLTAGALTPTATATGVFRQLIFIATTTTSGWVVPGERTFVGTPQYATTINVTEPGDTTEPTGTFVTWLNAGQTIAVAVQSVRIDATGRWALTDASSETTSEGILGVTVQTATVGNPASVLTEGFMFDDTFTFSPGADIYLSETTGAWTSTAPTASGAVVRQVGVCVNADVVYFNPNAYGWVTNP